MTTSILKSLVVLQDAVRKSVVKADKADTENILFEGSDSWVEEMLTLEAGLTPEQMLEAKEGGNLFSQPLSLYSRIKKATAEMVDVIDCKKSDHLLYAQLTGHDLLSVCTHKADNSIKVRKAIVDGAYISEPLIRVAQEKRNALQIQVNTALAQLQRVMAVIETLPEKEAKKLDKAIDAAAEEIEALNLDLVAAKKLVTTRFETAQQLEKDYGFTFDSTGKKIFNKDSEFNESYGKVLKEGRTALTELKKHLGMRGIDSVIPLSEVKHSAKIFGLAI